MCNFKLVPLFLMLTFFGDSFCKITTARNELINRTIEALAKDLQYILAHHDVVNVDCIFGVTFAKVFLEDARQISPNSYMPQIEAMLLTIDDIYFKSWPYLSNFGSYDMGKYLINPAIWLKPVAFRSSRLDIPKMGSFPENKVVDLSDFDENLSDRCLKLLVNQTVDLKPKKCYLNHECYTFIADRNLGDSYVTTHKLLVIQTAKRLQCKIHTQSYNYFTRTYCKHILDEIIKIELPSQNFEDYLDLLLEQILLCGYEGYKEFLNVAWLEAILRRQLAVGCWNGDGTWKTSKGVRKRRSSQTFADGCTDHASGLAAGVLGLYANYLIRGD